MNRRTIRRFKQEPVSYEILKRCVNAARLSPSAGNLQPLEFIIVDEKHVVDSIFPCLSWAGYLQNWSPAKNERPTAYIVILINRKKRPDGGEYDVGIAAEAITLVAQESGIGSCIIQNVDKARIKEILNIPEYCDVQLIIALGYPNENPVIEELNSAKSIKYWKDENEVLHVPKRPLSEVLHRNRF